VPLSMTLWATEACEIFGRAVVAHARNPRRHIYGICSRFADAFYFRQRGI
jgi:hypothetical protein